ncbi:MAG: hypothetical protein ABSD78_19100, partial [Acidimicrobiales bacterium]
MPIGDVAVIDTDGLEAMIALLAELGYETKGPVVRNGAIVPGPVTGVADLPAGYHHEQAPGHYRLERGDDDALFAWGVGPGSWEAEVFPPTQDLSCARVDGDGMTFTQPEAPAAPLAIIGARPCELAALKVLDGVLMDCAIPDPRYVARRDGAFTVAAECGNPAATCICASMGTGPGADGGYDLALSELDDADGHRFVVRTGTERGAEVLAHVPTVPATDSDLEGRSQMLSSAAGAMGHRLETEGLPALLVRNEHGATVRAMAAAIEEAVRAGEGTSTAGQPQLSPVRRRVGE